jgi:hypothetical protein
MKLQLYCIDSEHFGNKPALTVGGIYDIYAIGDRVHVKNDKNKYCSYPLYRFGSIDEWREKQLNDLLK